MASAVRNSRRRSRSPSSHSGILYRSAIEVETSMISPNGQQDSNMFLPVSSNPDAEVREINSNFHSPLEGSRDSLSGNDSPDQITACGRFVRPDREDAREETLRQRCAFFFMDPIQKFIAKRQAPWKLILQFAKIILITAQLLVFGQFRYAHTNYYKDNHLAYEHIFLMDWDPTREINAYPPSTGKYAIYKKEAFYQYFDYAAKAYYNLEDLSVIPTFRNSTLDFCVEQFESEGSDDFDVSSFEKAVERMSQQTRATKSRCISIPDEKLANFSSMDYLEKKNFPIVWADIIELRINLTLTTVTNRQLGPNVGPECFKFKVDIVFDNHDHDGQIPVNMRSTPFRIKCPIKDTELEANTSYEYMIRTLSIIVCIVCLNSFILCCRALIRAQILAHDVSNFLDEKFKIKLRRLEKLQFLNLWYVIICINDILIIIGTILKEVIESKRTNTDLWDFCSTFLGIGNLLVWVGMLRYLGFFQKYNTIMLTIKQAMPNIIRFTICVLIIYMGFVFCGWVVLGPYHYKFYTLSSTSECLFSLINGDDMFATFNMISSSRGMIWGFSRIYLYLFVIIFIYVVLSLFIAIIMDSYELVKEHYKTGFPKSRLDDFYQCVKYDIYSKTFCGEDSPSLMYVFYSWIMIKRYGPHFQAYTRDTSSRTGPPIQDLAPLVT